MRRHGFTTIEVLVVLAVLVALTAVILPQVAQRARDATGTAVLSTLATVTDGINEFKADARRYPGQLQWLATTTGAPTDICGTAIPAGLLSRWAGPYVQQHIQTTGIPAGDATILNTLVRANPSSTPVSSIIITAINVGQRNATRIEQEIDGNANFSTGSIRWVTGGSAPDTLRYYLPIRGC